MDTNDPRVTALSKQVTELSGRIVDALTAHGPTSPIALSIAVGNVYAQVMRQAIEQGLEKDKVLAEMMATTERATRHFANSYDPIGLEPTSETRH